MAAPWFSFHVPFDQLLTSAVYRPQQEKQPDSVCQGAAFRLWPQRKFLLDGQ